jgi:hypothetical protein
MRFVELTTRALLGGLAMDHLESNADVSPNPAGLLIRQSGTCDPGETRCGTGCMPSGSVCCAA